jgi:c-di-GMP-binding flagellar brake protein YcgR
MFAASVRRIQRDWKISDEASADAVLLEFPTQIKSIQRRANYRVAIPADIGMTLRVWRLGTAAYIKEQPMSSQEIRCEVRDLSVNGVGVRFIGKDGQPPKVTPEDRLRVQITLRDHKLIVEGRMRIPSKTCEDGTLITGIHFKKLENDLEGRQTAAQLTRIVGELQREEIRRVRMGLAQVG